MKVVITGRFMGQAIEVIERINNDFSLIKFADGVQLTVKTNLINPITITLRG